MEGIQFYSKSTKYFEFSNFYEAHFELDGNRWKTVEHYFQYQKFPGDTVLQEKIYTAETPAIAKRLGRTKSALFRKDWNTARDHLMKTAVMAKFQQNPKLAELLKSTGTRPLYEKSPGDVYWGIGKGGTGENKLGKILMDVRLIL